MSFTAPKFTNAGKELLSRALSGDCTVCFTSLALGSGTLSSQAIAAMTGLIAEQKRVGLEVYQRIDGETVNVRGTFNNSELTTGFYWREVGLYAQNPDDPDNRAADILYCYQNAGDLAEYIPSVNNEVMEKTISLTTKISDAAEVTALLLSEVYASKEEVEEGYVKKTGDTMTGDLAIMKPNSHIYLGHGDFHAGSAPTETKAATVEFKDANGRTIGVVQSVISPDGSGKLALWHADASGAKNGGILLVGTDKDGKPIFTHLDNAILTEKTGVTLEGNQIVRGQKVFASLESSGGNGAPALIHRDANGDGGGQIWLFDKDDDHHNGGVLLRAIAPDGSIGADCILRCDGSMIIGGKNVARSINGVDADNAGLIVEPGFIVPFAGNNTPPGRYLLCNGAAVSRTTYAALFTAIGGTYGVGDGSTTFNLPNLTDKFIQGSATAGGVIEAGLPNIEGHTGYNVGLIDGNTPVSGAFYKSGAALSFAGGSYTANTNVQFSAAKSNAIYGASTTVQPPAVTMRFYIKY